MFPTSLHNIRLEFRQDDIQYLPSHRCPHCYAPAAVRPDGSWFEPYQDWFNTPLRYWTANLGYVRFLCPCVHHAELGAGVLRIARLGDAILPMPFDDGRLARSLGIHTAQVNATYTSQAVQFLADHADPARTARSDEMAQMLYAIAAGGFSPDRARVEIECWLEQQVQARLNQIDSPIPMGFNIFTPA